ncbi:MAG: COX15/CtaA family protein [Bacteroidetes bacterium]|nr:COX15/CtaA family protein [Bacteroidota bacterium]
MTAANKPIITWLLTGCILIYVMVVVGGITRLTHSGLSMVEWNMLLGTLPPSTDGDWDVLFDKYKQSPEFKELNYDFTREDFKSIFWWEYIHRFIGRLIGVVFIIPLLYFLWRKKINTSDFSKFLVLLLLGAFQGVLGWYMVKSGLSKNPYVSHYRLAAHLISAFTVFGVTFWVALGYIYPKSETGTPQKKLFRLSVLLLLIVSLQIVYGAFVAGLKAGYYYPTFPKMGNSWIAEGVTYLQPFYINFLEGIAGVQFVHRYLAYVVFIVVLVIWAQTRKPDFTGDSIKKAANALLTIVSIQFVLGVLTILYSVPVVLGVLHQTGAFFLFAACVFFLFFANQTKTID